MIPYEYTEPAGPKIEIVSGTAGAFVEVNSYGDAHIVDVPKAEVPAAALALYEAAGLPLPMILDEIPGPDSLGDVAPFVTVEPSPAGEHPGNLPGVMLILDGSHVRLIRNEPLDVAAALIGAMRASVQRPEPDDDEVSALALTIHKANCQDGCDYAPTVDDRNIARMVLLSGYVKREPEQ